MTARKADMAPHALFTMTTRFVVLMRCAAQPGFVFTTDKDRLNLLATIIIRT